MAVATKETTSPVRTVTEPTLLPVIGAGLLIVLCAFAALVWVPQLVTEITVAATAIAILIADWFTAESQQAELGCVGIFGLLIALGANVGLQMSGYQSADVFGGALATQGFGTAFRLMILGSGAATLALSLDYVGRRIRQRAEYYALMVFSVLGAILLASANEMITFFLALEMTSIPAYLLATLRKDDAKSSEAGLKYLLVGALSSAFLLYGFSWLFGMVGSTQFATVAAGVSQMGVNPPLVMAMCCTIGGVLYKLAAVPFHMWAPDVYEGAPLPTTAFLSVTSKMAGVAGLLRLIAVPFSSGQLETRWVLLIGLLAAVTMTLGNVVALAQRNIKRLFAYSSIAHAGYLMAGLVAVYRPDTLSAGVSAVTFYLLTYAFANLGAFGVMLYVGRELESAEIGAYAGLAKRAPWTAAIMALCLISLAGLPPLAGFMGKFYLFGCAVQAGMTWLAVVGVLNSVISLYYYVAIIKQMYFVEPNGVKTFAPPAPGVAGVLGLAFLGVLLLFVMPAPVLTWITNVVGNL